MIDEQFMNLIRNQGYTQDSQFASNPKCLIKLIAYCGELPIESDSFRIIKQLMEYFRVPIFIAFKPFYDRLRQNASEAIDKFGEELQDVAAHVKLSLGEYELQELNYFYFAGIKKMKKMLAPRSEVEIQFLQYISKLGKTLRKLKDHAFKIDSEDLKLELDSILAEGLPRKLNVIESNYEQFFKKKADQIYNQNREQILKQELLQEANTKQLQPSSKDQNQAKQVPICCRQFFYHYETIRQPENLVLEYKNYWFPFDEPRTAILKKTICAFLNTSGGIVFLGVQEHLTTKKRIIMGMQLNQSEKEELLKSITMIARSIEPDILINRLYSVQFVPVKAQQHPHNYISGRFVVKIRIGHGIRNQIYSYRHDRHDYFSFRTENEVVHREGREVLNAYRQRLKNPLPEPVPLHQGPCLMPEKGRQIYNSFYVARKGNKSEYNYDSYSPADRSNHTNIQGESSNPDKSYQNKSKFRQKNAMDYIFPNMKDKELTARLEKRNLLSSVKITYQDNVSLLKIVDMNKKMDLLLFFSELDSENIEIFELERGFKACNRLDSQTISDVLRQREFPFTLIDKKQNVFSFKSSEEAIQAFLILHQLRIKVEFIRV